VPGGLTLLFAVLGTFIVWLAVLHQIPRFAMPAMAIACVAAAPMVKMLLARMRIVPIGLFLLGLPLIVFFCLSVPAHTFWLRVRMHDWSRATYYGYPPLIDKLSPGSRILDHSGTHSTSFQLAGASLTNFVFPASDLDAVDYVAKSGPEDTEDQTLRQRGAKLIYDATPVSLHPKVALHWRIYLLHQ